MPSKLVNLIYALKWQDFQGRVPAHDEHDAFTSTTITYAGLSPERRGSGVTLKDNVTVTVVLQRDKCWVKSGKDTDKLLNHEQRHFDIKALAARDIFIDFMGLKERTFPNVGALQAELARLQRHYLTKWIHEAYDDEADHGQIQTEQTKWDGMIKKAFTSERSPRVLAPDGTPYKLRLLDVLRDNGITRPTA
jgi:hypothetical protein